ncbi:transcriptional regulator [Haloferax sp. AS1]|uniref:HVO_A0114 family putative DNA-binding protein n=1 Tax=Haloferax sp. AS1 TaxID=2562277 RepID=UPI00165F67FA|nr:transcriptional regulator [Haloferax sp. AS1]MBC9986764.1 transcriptional regulator [Haloferax sp. AS1]
MTKLKVTVGEGNDLDETTKKRLKAAQAGEAFEDAQPVLNFDSFAELSRLLSPKNLELLEAIAAAEPDSIREAAELVDRDYKQVHRNLTELTDLGVIDFEGGDPGLPKKPVLAYDGLEINLSFNNSNNLGATPR